MKTYPILKLTDTGRLLCPISFSFIVLLLDLKYFCGSVNNTFKQVEFKSEVFPLRRPEVFSQTDISSSQISRQIFSLFNDMDGWTHEHAWNDMRNENRFLDTF